MYTRLRNLSVLAAFALHSLIATAQVGLTKLPGAPGDGPITVFYPSGGTATPVQRGPFSLQVAVDGTTQPGNRRLIVISHGSGAAPWVQTDLAQHLVQAGYIVALPEHVGDNWHDMDKVGPESWKLRPLEVSRAIDVLARDARLGPLFDATRVGMHGMSAGGHTALTLAGGRWSKARLLAHCEANLAEDFVACTGAATELSGGPLDGLKKAIALPLIHSHLTGDPVSYGHTDARIKAVLSAVPFAADFDPQSLANPAIPLGLIQARQDRWLVPRFHSAPVIAQCKSCTVVADLPMAGHGALLAPLPPDLEGRIGRLLADPPGFQRAELPMLYQRIEAFFNKHLLP